MQTESKNNSEKLDLTVIFKQIHKNWKLYAITLPIATVLGVVIAFSLPRYYECKVMLAPEDSGDGNGLSSLMSQFGFADASKTDDAISPNMYPDLMESQEFIVSLFDINIKTKDKKTITSYYDYLENYQKSPWWSDAISGLIDKFKTKSEEPSGKTNPKMLTIEQDAIAKQISGKVQYDYDKKTGIITINVNDQDPVVSALIADTVSQRLQVFITDYRTKKARHDLEYSEGIYKKAKAEYEQAAAVYAASVDANWDIVNESYKMQQKKLENEMDMKFQAFNAINTKLQSAKLKVQENTPVFTMLQGPVVPVKPAGPKRAIILIGVFMFAFVITTIYVLIHEQKKANAIDK